MTGMDTLVAELSEFRLVVENRDYEWRKQNELLAALVATTQRIAVALESIECGRYKP